MKSVKPCVNNNVVHIPDVQNSPDTRQLPINKVGIKDIRHPVRVKDRSGGEQHTIANFNMYVNLLITPGRAMHMSRFVEILTTQERKPPLRPLRTC
ncbi:MAG: GTP cyclohydrolase, FolE2/MptA family [Candidatus Competibacteraceae bacterium]